MMAVGSKKKIKRVRADCYSARERAVMKLTQLWRARLLAPLLKRLVAFRVTPDAITLLSLLCGLAFCGFWFWSKPAAFCFLALHVLLDGLDGPLARHAGMASRKGSFTDTMSGQTVVVATTIALMAGGTVPLVAGGIYIVLYTVVVLFAMVRNALAIPYSWLVRPRFFVFAGFLAEVWIWPGTIGYVLWIANMLLAVKLLTGFVQIRRRI